MQSLLYGEPFDCRQARRFRDHPRGEARTTSGRPYDNQYCHVFKLQEGQILEVTEYLDTQLVNDVLA
jgi:ketosteroid isomerase-like protein